MNKPFARPAIPDELQAKIDEHMKLFAGFRMMADAGADGAGGDDSGADAGTSDDAKSEDDEELGAGGKKALDAERARRKALEKEIQGLKEFQANFGKALAPLIGGEPAKDGPDAIEKLTATVEQLQHENLVERVARAHKITDDKDLKLLASMKSEAELVALAARLSPSEDDKDGDDDATSRAKRGGRPRPDPSAGKGGGDNAGKSSVEAYMAERRAAREAKTK